MKCQGFHTYWTKLLLLSFWFGTVTSFSLCISLMHLGCTLMLIPWNSSIPLWSGFASCTHCMFSQMLSTASGYVLHHSTPRYLSETFYTVLWAAVCYLSQFSCHSICLSCFSSNAVFCALCTSTLCTHISSCSLPVSLMFLWVVSSFIILV